MKLTDMNLLAGQEENLSLSDFRRAPGDVITQVQMGKTFTLTRNGMPVAVLSKKPLSFDWAELQLLRKTKSVY